MTAPGPHPSDALLDYVYGELSPEEARRVQAHLDRCPECASHVAGYRAVRGAARALPRELPAGGAEALLLAARQTAERTRRRRLAFRAGTLVTAALAAALVLISLRPAVVPEAPSAVASAPAPAALPQGALAANEAQPSAGAAPGNVALASAPSAASAKKAKAMAPPPPPVATREASPRAEVAATESLKATSGADARAAAQPTLYGAPAARASAGGAPAPQTVTVSGLRGTAEADAQAAAAPAAQAAPVDASAQRTRDEARRQTLLLRLKDVSGAQALPLLSELCAIEARLQHLPEAQAACSRVVHGFPGTPEAASAQAELQRLGLSPKAF